MTASIEVATASTEVATASPEVAIVSTEVATASTEVAIDSTEVAIASTEVATISTEVATASTEVATASPEVASASTEVATASPEVATALTEVATASTEVASPSPEVAAASPEVAIASTEVVTATSEGAAASPEVALVSTEVATASTEIVTTSPEVVTASTEVMTASTQVATASTASGATPPRPAGRGVENVLGSGENPSRGIKLIMTKPIKPRPSLGVRRADVPGVLTRAGIMEAAILAAAAMFPSLPITMAAFLLLLQAAAAAQAAAATRALGLASLRDTKVDALWTAMQTLKTYVAGLASELDATSARSLIEAAGLLVAESTTHTKVLLSATYAPATGVVHVAVNALLLLGKRTSKKTTFTYSWSADGGRTWSAGVTTAYAGLDVPALPAGTYLFRVFATVGKVPGEPTQAVSLTLH